MYDINRKIIVDNHQRFNCGHCGTKQEEDSKGYMWCPKCSSELSEFAKKLFEKDEEDYPHFIKSSVNCRGHIVFYYYLEGKLNTVATTVPSRFLVNFPWIIERYKKSITDKGLDMPEDELFDIFKRESAFKLGIEI